MPVLKSIQKTKEITLPNFKDSKITILTEKNIGQQRDLQEKIKGKSNEVDTMIIMIVESIISWNFTNEDGTPAIVNEKAIKMLGDSDLEVIMIAITGKSMEELQEIGLSGNDKKKV